MVWREFTQRLYAPLALRARLCLRAGLNWPSDFICQLVVDHVKPVSDPTSNQQIQFEFRSRAVTAEEAAKVAKSGKIGKTGTFDREREI